MIFVVVSKTVREINRLFDLETDHANVCQTFWQYNFGDAVFEKTSV